MYMVRTISLPFTITGTEIRIPFKAMCSITGKPFSGIVRITYRPRARAIEFVDMEKVIGALCREKLTAEELTRRIYIDVKHSIRPASLVVAVDVKKSAAHQPVTVWIDDQSHSIRT